MEEHPCKANPVGVSSLSGGLGMKTFSTNEAIRMTGVSYRQFYYWLANDAITVHHQAPRQGYKNRLSAEDVAIVHALGRLAAFKCDIAAITRAHRALRVAWPIQTSGATLVVPGDRRKEAFLTVDGAKLTMSGPAWIVPLAESVELFRELQEGSVAA